MQFCQAFNAQTQDQSGTIIPVEITVYEDKSFTFVCKTPPAAVLIKEKLTINSGSGLPHVQPVGTLTEDQLREIAEIKMPDLNANDIDAAKKIIAGTVLFGLAAGFMETFGSDPGMASTPTVLASLLLLVLFCIASLQLLGVSLGKAGDPAAPWTGRSTGCTGWPFW